MRKTIFVLLSLLLIVPTARAQGSLVQQGKKQLKNEQFETAFSTFKKAAAQGNAEAMYYVGLCHENGYGTSQDIYEAMEWYLKSADKGNGEACYRVSKAYEIGTVVYPDEGKALAYMRRSAQKGCAAGEEAYACYLAYGNAGVTANKAEALRYFQRAAAKGFEDAYCDLAQIYFHGLCGFPVDKVKSGQYLTKLKACKTARGYNQLAYMYKDGSAGTVSLKEACDLFVKSGDMGFGKSYYEMGDMYYMGEIGESYESERMALYYLTKSFEKGFNMAGRRASFICGQKGRYSECLSLAFKSGDVIGVDNAIKQYGNYLSKNDVFDKVSIMAAKGAIYAQWMLANMYYDGDGVAKSYNDAYHWYCKAATNRDADVFPYGDTYNRLGAMCFDAQGTARDYTEAVKWFKKGANCKYNPGWAMYNLANCYFNGNGVVANDATGFSWMLKSAKANNTSAIAMVSVCYIIGKGTQKNSAEAYRWAKAGSDKGDKECQYVLATCYNNGIGTQQNISLCREYLTKSANQGYVAAQRDLNQLNSRQTTYNAYNNAPTPVGYNEMKQWYDQMLIQSQAAADRAAFMVSPSGTSSSVSPSGSGQCGVCKGSGKCIGCNGSGFTKDPYGRDCPCGACTKSGNVPGKCNVCHGTGAKTY